MLRRTVIKGENIRQNFGQIFTVCLSKKYNKAIVYENYAEAVIACVIQKSPSKNSFGI